MKKSDEEKWVSVAIYYDNLDALLCEVVAKQAEEILKGGIASKFIFGRSMERGKNLLLMFKTTQGNSDSQLKPKLFESISKYFEIHPAPQKNIELPINDWFLPFPNNYLHYNDNFLRDIMETGGLQASEVADEIMAESSKIVMDALKDGGEEWNVESRIGMAIQIHLGLVSAFGMDFKEISSFYSSCFNNILKVTQVGDDSESFKSSLISGLDENFETQKESLVGFIEYLLTGFFDGDDFEEDWINLWVSNCKIASEKIINLQTKGQFVAPENFVIDEALNIDLINQERWPVIEYYIRAINYQLGINDIFELNLIYSIKESINSLLETQKA